MIIIIIKIVKVLCIYVKIVSCAIIFWCYLKIHFSVSEWFFFVASRLAVMPAKLNPQLMQMIFSTENGNLKLKKNVRRADSSLANSRYARKQMKRQRQRKFGAALRVTYN